MKLCIIGDLHWSTYSSILRTRGNYFSTRLEYLIKTLDWVQEVSKKNNCDEEIYLGDFFDKPDLTSEEISALSEVKWNDNSKLRHFLVGNHESGVASLVYNSTQALHKLGVVESTPNMYRLDDKTQLLFLPYITEDNRKSLIDYIYNKDNNSRLIVFSHNDIKDFQMGKFTSKTGFEIDDIIKNCDLYINGHLHNGSWVSSKKILNLGNICGQNFSEDAFKYEHHIAILDTDTLEIEFIENPYALNFYKIEINDEKDLNILYKLKSNCVLAVHCLDSIEEKTRKLISSLSEVLSYKIVTYSSNTLTSDKETVVINNVDHLAQFTKFIIENLGNNDIVNEELSEVCK